MDELDADYGISLLNSSLGGNKSEFIKELAIGGIFRSTSFVAVGVLVLLTNVFSFIIIHRQNDLFGEVSRFFYRVLATVDVFGGLTGCIFCSIVFYRERWPFGFISCHILHWLLACSLGFSVTVLSCISLERYIAISRPLRYQTLVTLERSKIVLFVVMMLPVAVLALGFIPDSPLHTFARYQCYRYTNLQEPRISRTEGALVTTIFVISMSPVWMGVILNVRSMRISMIQARAVAAQQIGLNPEPNRMQNRRVEYKGVKTVLLISVVNAVSWLPAITIYCLHLYPIFVIPLWLQYVLHVLLMTGFCSNALVFAQTNAAYRNAAGKLYRSFFCRA